MTDPVQMYRLRVAEGSGSTTSGKWQYFENSKEFQEAVLSAAISAVAEEYRSQDRYTWIATKKWNEKVMIDPGGKWHVIKVVGADKLVDGQWVELKYTFHPPRLELEE